MNLPVFWSMSADEGAAVLLTAVYFGAPHPALLCSSDLVYLTCMGDDAMPDSLLHNS